MARKLWPLVLVAAVALSATQVSAGQGGGRFQLPMTIEQMNERLGDLKLTDEQATKVKAVNEEFTKKMDEANKKPGVAAAQEDVKKAREGGDRDAMRAAFTKLTEALGFNQRDEYKKMLTPVLKEDQIAKLFPDRGPGKKAN